MAKLDPTQYAAVKADILANNDLNLNANNDDGNDAIAKLYNLAASPAFSVWRNDTPIQDIFDKINWALYTPTDPADGTATHQERLLLIQVKQMNLQNMTIGRTTLDMGKANIRAGIRDAVIQVPSGASGALTAPGGASATTLLQACLRPSTRIEKLLAASQSDTTGSVSAGVLGFIGPISGQDITAARNS